MHQRTIGNQSSIENVQVGFGFFCSHRAADDFLATIQPSTNHVTDKESISKSAESSPWVVKDSTVASTVPDPWSDLNFYASTKGFEPWDNSASDDIGGGVEIGASVLSVPELEHGVTMSSLNPDRAAILAVTQEENKGLHVMEEQRHQVATFKPKGGNCEMLPFNRLQR